MVLAGDDRRRTNEKEAEHEDEGSDAEESKAKRATVAEFEIIGERDVDNET